jgi:hypothetical protein
MYRPLIIPLLALAMSVPLAAQTVTATLSADLGTIAKLSLSTTTLTFPDADPDLVPQVPASGGPVAITAKARAASGEIVLTVLANGPARSGVNTISADAFTWTASGSGFVAGTLSSTVPQQVASWNGSGIHDGVQSYLFRNSWNYPVGVYSMTLTYTLTAP